MPSKRLSIPLDVDPETLNKWLVAFISPSPPEGYTEPTDKGMASLVALVEYKIGQMGARYRAYYVRCVIDQLDLPLEHFPSIYPTALDFELENGEPTEFLWAFLQATDTQRFKAAYKTMHYMVADYKDRKAVDTHYADLDKS